jgi:heme/copper-type cytochrome/quinol oxidase subunit 3
VSVAVAREPGRSIPWWGVVTVIMTEATIFAGLLATYFFLRAASHQWPPAGVEPPELRKTIVFSIVLWGSSIPVAWAEHGIKRGDQPVLRAGLLLGWVMGAAFLGHTVLDFQALGFGWRDHAYGSIFYATVGLHALHVLVGLVVSAVVQVKAGLHRFDARRHATVEVFGLYWHFVDAVWVFVFAGLFLGAHVR